MIAVEVDVPNDWGVRWPCSRLAGKHIRVVQDSHGDLLEFEVDESDPPVDVDNSELNAVLDTYVSRMEVYLW